MSNQEHVLQGLLDRVRQRKKEVSAHGEVVVSGLKNAPIASPTLPTDFERTAEHELQHSSTDAYFSNDLPNVDTAVRSVPYMAEASSVRHEAVRPKSIAPPSVPIAQIVSEASMESPLTFGQLIKRTLSLRPK